MKDMFEAIKTIAAAVGVISVFTTSIAYVTGKADQSDVAEIKSRVSVVETRLTEMDKKIDVLLSR